MLKRFCLLATVVFAAGCASTTQGTGQAPERVLAVDERSGTVLRTRSERTPTTVLQAPMDKVWDAVVSSYRMLAVDLTHVNQPAGEVGNRQFTMSRRFFNKPVSTYLNCGDEPLLGPRADSYPVTASFITRLRADGTSTVLETSLSGSMTKTGGSTGEVYCSTTGALESQFAAMVESRID
ncbi:MAG: hypothetical protein ACSLFK_12265 [Gemmatimonadaceae bacterium]